eukprot:6201707-Pleurochrysis_carterae.AAC.3
MTKPPPLRSSPPPLFASDVSKTSPAPIIAHPEFCRKRRRAAAGAAASVPNHNSCTSYTPDQYNCVTL